MIALTVSEAEHPQSRDGVLGEVLLLAGAVVKGVAHFFFGVQPLVGEHGDDNDEKRSSGGQRCEHP